jgi:phytoene dehydrogenase-like protein
LGHRETILFYNDSLDFRYERPEVPVDVRSGIICAPDNFEYDGASDENKLRITALAEPKYWMELEQDRYVQEKERWNQRVIESALRFMPDFRHCVIDTDMFTPRTIRKFTGHVNGCVYGAPKKQRDGRTHLENLFLCGTDQGFLGIVGAMLSGITIANLHLLRAAEA